MIRICLIALLTLACAAASAAPDPAKNLLANPGFEAEDAGGWEKRTPDDADRTLSIIPEAARSGKKGARIVNRKATNSRWRFGADEKVQVPEGSVVRLAGWIRANLAEGSASLRLYAMRTQNDILAQCSSRPVTGTADWTRVSVTATVPPGTAFLMAYLEMQSAAGTADYDDLSLEVVAPPEPRRELHDLLLLTDAPADDPTVTSLETLYPGRVVRAEPGAPVAWEKLQGAIAFLRKPESVLDFAPLERFAAGGKPVVMDLDIYARARNLEVKETTGAEQPLLRVLAEDPITGGFRAGDEIPWCAGKRGAFTQRVLAEAGRARVLGESSRGGALLLSEAAGKGILLAADLAGLPEPAWNVPGSLNKYLFLGNLLGKSVRYGRHLPRRLRYDEFVAAMRALAAENPALRFEEEGPAHGEYRLFTLNLGDPAKPAFFLYADTHGSEWEPAYGLLELARLLASPEGKDLFDTARYSLKILPIVNPSGYDLNTRQNANKVDLNRNGGNRWEEYQGRDANKDGAYGPGDYDWKGAAPFSEPETQTFRRICERLKPVATLDFHGNAGGPGNNRLVMLPGLGCDENEERAHRAVREFNRAIRDRYVLLEASRPAVQQYEIESVAWDGPRPTLIEVACPGRLGLICEVPAGYGGTYGTVFQTDVVIETCLAFIRAYQ